MCPICGNKLRSTKMIGTMLYTINKHAHYTDRLCSGSAHTLQIFVDEATGRVDLLRLSLNAVNSKYLDIDYHNQKSRISCMKNGVPHHITVDRIIEPDFPDLVKLNEKVQLYIVFS